MATKDDESTPRRPMTKCELLAWALWTDTRYVTYRW